MKKLIVNGDDFGYCEALNYGILKAYKKGILRSTTMMVNMPGYEHALSILAQEPQLACGIHLTLDVYKPTLTTHKTLVDEAGYFFKRPDFKTLDMNEVYEEWCAQIDKALQDGVKVTHLDSHHHLHTLPIFKDILIRLEEKYHYPMRGGFSYDSPLKNQSILITDFYQDQVNIDGLKKILQSFEDDKLYDIMCHPAYLDQFLLDSTSYAILRPKELEVLCSDEILQEIKKLDITLCTYHDI